MTTPAFETPVCLIIFRRPEHTRRVLEAIARVRPSRLFVVADGPRQDHPKDVDACAAARAEIERIDWPCEIVRNYSDGNLGCGMRPATGITWLFQQVEEAIILEDDCLPDPSFFRYCAELLEKYRDDPRVMHISGCSYRGDDPSIRESYYFIRSPGCWGWATWRRAWAHYDISARIWPSLRGTSLLKGIVATESVANEHGRALDHAYELKGNCSYWDYQWALACWANSGLSIFPRNNLITNEGCGEDATHTFDPGNPVANLPTREMEFPLVHPDAVTPNQKLESYMNEWSCDEANSPNGRAKGLLGLLRRKARKAAPSLMKSILRRFVFPAGQSR